MTTRLSPAKTPRTSTLRDSRSSTTTEALRATRARTRWRPTKPRPPVIKNRPPSIRIPHPPPVQDDDRAKERDGNQDSRHEAQGLPRGRLQRGQERGTDEVRQNADGDGARDAPGTHRHEDLHLVQSQEPAEDGADEPARHLERQRHVR